VTHDQAEAFAMSDRLAVMNQGRILQVDTPENVYRSPVSPFVADFVGNLNHLHGYVVHRDGRSFADCSHDVVIELPDSYGKMEIGEKVLLGIRPESIQVSSDRSDLCPIQATVQLASFLGNHYRLVVTLSNGAVMQIEIGRDVAVAPEGQAVWIGWPVGAMSIFAEENDQ
jgi:ABC-type Fe3+/spermidine/putrescine transport system ATPase subunit